MTVSGRSLQPGSMAGFQSARTGGDFVNRPENRSADQADRRHSYRRFCSRAQSRNRRANPATRRTNFPSDLGPSATRPVGRSSGNVSADRNDGRASVLGSGDEHLGRGSGFANWSECPDDDWPATDR